VVPHAHQVKNLESPQNEDFVQIAQFYRFGDILDSWLDGYGVMAVLN
jgi:hypothetical protein